MLGVVASNVQVERAGFASKFDGPGRVGEEDLERRILHGGGKVRCLVGKKSALKNLPGREAGLIGVCLEWPQRGFIP